MYSQLVAHVAYQSQRKNGLGKNWEWAQEYHRLLIYYIKVTNIPCIKSLIYDIKVRTVVWERTGSGLRSNARLFTVESH
jgi:hypothetical protein